MTLLVECEAVPTVTIVLDRDEKIPPRWEVKDILLKAVEKLPTEMDDISVQRLKTK